MHEIIYQYKLNKYSLFFLETDGFETDPLKIYDKFTNLGFWRYLVVRQSDKTKEILINIVVCDEGI